MNAEAERPEKGLEDEAAEGTETEPQVETEAESPDDVESAEGEELSVDTLQAKADENWDRYLRASAELENVRKRASRDVENARKFALERFGKELLTVRDTLEMGLAATDSASVESLLEGKTATLKMLTSVMQQFGIEEVDPAGEPFDPDFHEAISMQPSDDIEPGSVVQVVQKGYSLNGRLLRPAMVIVAAE